MITVFVLGGHPVETSPKVAAKRKRAHPIEKNPLVTFYYPHKGGPDKIRSVRVIGANDQYLVGVQIDGKKSHYKKFLKYKIRHLHLTEFSPLSVS